MHVQCVAMGVLLGDRDGQVERLWVLPVNRGRHLNQETLSRMVSDLKVWKNLRRDLAEPLHRY